MGLCGRSRCNDSAQMLEWRKINKCANQDTYIEWLFSEKCKELPNREEIWNEWCTNKRQYISYLNEIALDFQHFSRHDASHSICILESIEMLLGKERIDLLSVSDLWLLLESAYMHDMGMNLSYQELIELWENDKKFKEYIKNCVNEKHDDQNAAIFYTALDNLLHNKEILEGINNHNGGEDVLRKLTASWPVQFERGIAGIIANYIRGQHAQRAIDARKKLDEKKNPAIPIRLYNVMIKVCQLHTCNFEDIYKELKYSTDGFGIEKMHPYFAAAMLRIGDVLDMDNNRFNVAALEHFGDLPVTSLLHYNKHKAITHIEISEEIIEAEAFSSDIEVCKTVDSWFKLLKQEMNSLINSWNKIVPPKLFGCLIQDYHFEVYYQTDAGVTIFTSKTDKSFEVNKEKLLGLLMGMNIYDSNVDFLREYLQNALDAVKMRLWLDIKSDKYRYTKYANQKYISQNSKKNEITPFDLAQEIYNLYALEVRIKMDEKKHIIHLSIVDNGIGMEKECIESISKIGTGWRKREKYHLEIQEMPKWLRPTGGFGIGMQSAFMVTDCFEIITRGTRDKNGEDKTRKLVVTSPSIGGRIMEEEYETRPQGTTVNIPIDIGVFQSLDLEDFEISNPFENKEIQKYIVNYFEKYIQKKFSDTPIPIRIVYEDEYGKQQSKEIRSTHIPEGHYWDETSSVISKEIQVNEKKYLCLYENLNSKEHIEKIIMWEYENCILADLSIHREDKEAINEVAFKNVLVSHEKVLSKREAPYIDYYDVYIDYQGFYAEDILKIHRENFNDQFKQDVYFHQFLNVYTLFLKKVINELKNSEDKRIDVLNKEYNNVINKLVQILYFNEETDYNIDDLAEDTKQKSVQKIIFDEENGLEIRMDRKQEVEILKNILSVLNPKKTEITSGSIYVIAEEEGEKEKKKKKEKNLNQGTLLNSKLVKNWVIANEEERKQEEFEKVNNIFGSLETDKYIITDKSLAQVLIKNKLLKKKEYVTWHVEKENIDIKFYQLVPKEKEEKLDDETFYKMSIEVQEFEWVYAQRYEELRVKVIPFKKRKDIDGNKEGYLLSPILKNKQEILKQLRDIDSIETYPIEKFRDIIMDNQEYRNLINWVYNNQYGQKVQLKTIEEVYLKYIDDIRDWMIRSK